ncbi:transcription elongation factor A protein 3 isoform X3 [Halichoeres trimaculatus]|uniref:transcription elongation factor A protein 3 isoform X3 n=1 Tax=Halichoeres trimaculatus TaxID=147232 RepID=UPI003D9F0F6E
MTRDEDLIRIAKKLDKMVSRNNTEGAIDLLRELKGFNMTLKLLQETRIGMSVNGIRKHCTDEEVIALAKVLIKDWKRLLDSGSSHSEKPADTKNGLDSSKAVPSPHSSPSDTQSSHRRLDIKPKQDTDPDKKQPEITREEKHNDEHKNKKRHDEDPGHEKRPQEHQHEKKSQEIQREKYLEELKKHRTVENHKADVYEKKQKHVQDLQNEKHKPEPRRERSFEDPKKMRLMEEVRKDKHQEEVKKHGFTDDMKRHREDSRHERPVNSLHRDRPPCEKPADAHRPLFERRGVLDSSILYPTRFPSPRPERPPLLIKRLSVEQKKERSGLLFSLI